jgi:hypothetical protein
LVVVNLFLFFLGFFRAYLVWLGCLVPGLYEVIQNTLSLSFQGRTESQASARGERARRTPHRQSSGGRRAAPLPRAPLPPRVAAPVRPSPVIGEGSNRPPAPSHCCPYPCSYCILPPSGEGSNRPVFCPGFDMRATINSCRLRLRAQLSGRSSPAPATTPAARRELPACAGGAARGACQPHIACERDAACPIITG